MNIAEISIRKRTITLVLTALLAVGGVISYEQLPRLEDPEYTIKTALVMTPYPGATAREVEEEVTDVIEKAAQQLGQLKRVKSKSERGLSTVEVEIKDKFDRAALPQVWDELRRKVNDARSQLPPGAGPSLVNDDFGDVYGIFVAITGDGYSYAELKEYAKLVQRELLLVQDVKKIELYGAQPEVIYVKMSRQKLAQLGIPQEAIFRTLALTGMLIKNSIVLLDQVGIEIEEGKDSFNAVVDSGVSRMRPVSMAAITTILGMTPLFLDAFFKAMAVTIMFGLGFATILTLIVVPVLYVIFFRVPYPAKDVSP
jgi:multidrug efflux pump subunit AcrB